MEIRNQEYLGKCFLMKTEGDGKKEVPLLRASCNNNWPFIMTNIINTFYLFQFYMIVYIVIC